MIAFYRGFEGSSHVQYWMTALALSSVYPLVPIVFSWVTNNVRGQTKVATGTALVSSFGSVAGAIGPQIWMSYFRPSDAANLYKTAVTCNIKIKEEKFKLTPRRGTDGSYRTIVATGEIDGDEFSRSGDLENGGGVGGVGDDSLGKKLEIEDGGDPFYII
ncbi:hypothetical protein HDU76_003524 [Blyttiomyces sp. JEL0837]|nr:hypothetical protein HDU76_003524 [Blyttiomyces sp. JEL0837]